MKSEMRIFAFAPQTLKIWGVNGGYRLTQQLAVARRIPFVRIKVFRLVFSEPKHPINSVIKAESSATGSSHVGSGSNDRVMNLQFCSSTLPKSVSIQQN